VRLSGGMAGQLSPQGPVGLSEHQRDRLRMFMTEQDIEIIQRHFLRRWMVEDARWLKVGRRRSDHPRELPDVRPAKTRR
jgi:hypothetical protein